MEVKLGIKIVGEFYDYADIFFKKKAKVYLITKYSQEVEKAIMMINKKSHYENTYKVIPNENIELDNKVEISPEEMVIELPGYFESNEEYCLNSNSRESIQNCIREIESY